MKMNRRELLTAMAFGAAMTAAGCSQQPTNDRAVKQNEMEGATFVKTVCRYCGTGCGVLAAVKDGKLVGVKGDPDNTVNKGLLCVKAFYLHKYLNAPDRFTTPLIRKGDKLEPATWDEALNLVATTFKEIIAKDGPDALGFYGSGQCSVDEAYLYNKLYKGCIGTNNVDGNPRTCMASAVAGFAATFGKDEPMGTYDDIEQATVFVAIGANMAECHPILYSRISDHKAKNPNVKLVVADPRRHRMHDMADITMQFKPGTDSALLNAMAHVIVNENLIDQEFVAKHTTCNDGTKAITFEEYKQSLDSSTPEWGEKVTGVPADVIRQVARLYGDKKQRVMTTWTMGINQRTNGTMLNTQIYNLHLLTGQICKPGASPFSLTGQPSACGSVRETGALAHLLPGHRQIANAQHREEVAKVWGVDPKKIKDKPGLPTMKLFDATVTGAIRGLFVMCTNPGHSLPNVNKYREGMKKTFLVVSDIYPNRTTELADVVFPAATWIEKEGFYGNAERRTQHLAKGINPPGEAKPDQWILMELAKRMGHGDAFAKYTSMEVIWEEYRSLTLGTGADLAPYQALVKAHGLRWPYVDGMEGSMRYVYPNDHKVKPEEGIKFYGKPDGKAVIYARPTVFANEQVSPEYPFWYSTGRILEHWHTITMTGRVPELKRAASDFYCELNKADAARLGVKNGEKIRITSRRGSIVVNARVGGRGEPQEGMAMSLMHDDAVDRLCNIITNDAVDPTSAQPEYKLAAVRIEKA
ncbi:MAG TPA: molybdopterin-dependent oxidoreductase [Symbiobacteriaceae bacterium]|jgi:nitrate reductase NapA|nr:molybdopterin-dependent oxidoreductase [Symbiobacteriaceae bacterium]